MPKFKLIVAIVLCLLATAGAIFLIVTKNKNELIIKLNSNPTTGYSWTYTIEDQEIVEIKEDFQNECDAEVTGCGGESVFTIKPLKKGKTNIIFKYTRSWESEENPVTAIYEVTVGSNMKITETHTGSYFE